jgi:6-phosphogluconolactonase
MNEGRKGSGGIRVFPDPEALSHGASEFFVSLALAAIHNQGRFSAALSGGSTPRHLYRLLATPEISAKLPWPKIDLFWSDERCVPPDHRESNYGMAREELLSKISIPRENIHPMPGEMNPKEGALQYENELKRYFSKNGQKGLDLVLLGVGNDGHTASLFPYAATLEEKNRLVVPATSPVGTRRRLTMTFTLLNRSGSVLFCVSGGAKAAVLAKVFQPGAVAKIPARGIRPSAGELHWFVDRDAAVEMKG